MSQFEYPPPLNIGSSVFSADNFNYGDKTVTYNQVVSLTNDQIIAGIKTFRQQIIADGGISVTREDLEVLEGDVEVEQGNVECVDVVASGDITFGNTLNGLSTGTFAKIEYLQGVSMDIQGQLDDLSDLAANVLSSSNPTLTGVVQIVADDDHDGDLSVDGTLTLMGNLVCGAHTLTQTELGYLDGITSSVQTQLGSLASAISSTIANVALCATLSAPALTGNATCVTQANGDNSTRIASTAYVLNATAIAIANLVDSAPSTLNTLNELSAALGNDPSFATTVSTSIGTKAPLLDPNFTGVPTAPTASLATSTTQIATTSFVKQNLSDYQPVINSGARVNANLIGTGAVSNTAFGYIANVSSDVQAQIANLATLASPVFSGTLSAAAVSCSSIVNSGMSTSQKICEPLSTSYSFSSNILSYDYANGAICAFSGLTANTNFEVDFTNVNPSTLQNKIFTISLLIDTSSYSAYANTCKINGGSQITPKFPGTPSLTGITSTGLVLQTFTIIYTSSSSTPYRVLSAVNAYY